LPNLKGYDALHRCSMVIGFPSTSRE